MKSGSLNVLEPSGPVKACNGIALPFTRNISWTVKAASDILITFMCRLSWNLGTSTSWNPQGLSRIVHGLLYLFILITAVQQYRCVNLLGGCNCRGSLHVDTPSCLVLDGQPWVSAFRLVTKALRFMSSLVTSLGVYEYCTLPFREANAHFDKIWRGIRNAGRYELHAGHFAVRVGTTTLDAFLQQFLTSFNLLAPEFRI
jgi:hypothetical protein